MYRLTLLGIFTVAAVIRLAAIESDPLGSPTSDVALYVDEGLKAGSARNLVWFRAARPVSADMGANHLAGSPIPTLLFAAMMWASGAGLAAPRCFNAFADAVTVLGVAWLAGRRRREAGLFAAALYGLHPQAVLHARLALFDPVMIACAVFAMAAAMETRRPGMRAAVSGVGLGAALLAKVTVAPIALAGCVSMLLVDDGPGLRRRSRRMLAFTAPITGAVVYLAFQGFGRADRSAVIWLAQLQESFGARGSSGAEGWNLRYALSHGVLAQSLPLIVAAGLSVVVAWAHCRLRIISLMTWIIAVAAPLPFYSKGLVPARYTLPLVPALCALAALSASSDREGANSNASRRGVTLAARVAVAAQLAVSVWTLAGWFGHLGYQGQAARLSLARELSRTERVAGLWAPALAFESRAVTIAFNVNDSADSNVSCIEQSPGSGCGGGLGLTHLLTARGRREEKFVRASFPDARPTREFRVGNDRIVLARLGPEPRSSSSR